MLTTDNVDANASYAYVLQSAGDLRFNVRDLGGGPSNELLEKMQPEKKFQN